MQVLSFTLNMINGMATVLTFSWIQWKSVEKKEDTIYTSILQVMFIPFDGPTAKQKVIIRESSWEPHPHLLDFDPGEAQDNEEKERKYEESAQNEETRQKLASERNKSVSHVFHLK